MGKKIENPAVKVCAGCKVEKDRFKDFRPRWGRCKPHRGMKKAEIPADCAECISLRNHVIRQPRCVECDAARGKAKAAEKKAAKAEVKLLSEMEKKVAELEAAAEEYPECGTAEQCLANEANEKVVTDLADADGNMLGLAVVEVDESTITVEDAPF